MIRPSSCSADVAPAAVVAVAEDQLAGGHEPREQFRQRDRLARRDMPADPRGEAGHAHGDEGLVHGPSTNWSSPATPSDTSENRNSAGVVHDTSMSYRARGGCRDVARDPVFSRIALVFGPAAPPARPSSGEALPPKAAAIAIPRGAPPGREPLSWSLYARRHGPPDLSPGDPAAPRGLAVPHAVTIRGPDGRIARIRYVLPRHKAANWVGPGRGRKSTRPKPTASSSSRRLSSSTGSPSSSRRRGSTDIATTEYSRRITS